MFSEWKYRPYHPGKRSMTLRLWVSIKGIGPLPLSDSTSDCFSRRPDSLGTRILNGRLADWPALPLAGSSPQQYTQDTTPEEFTDEQTIEHGTDDDCQ